MASRLNKTVDAAPTAVLTLGCLYMLGILAVWITVIVIVLHFVGKFW